MLSPYTPKLTLQTAAHLLKRITFGQNIAQINSLVGLTASEAVNKLLTNGLMAPKPKEPEWLKETYLSWWRLPGAESQKQIDFVYKRVYDLNYQLKYDWGNELEKDDYSIREKMTLFWHGHFTTKFAIDQVMVAPLMYNQIDLFRSNHIGNFRHLVEQICIDGAMLIFLNGVDSTSAKPNENFSRELLELYTCGIGHYTEDDVKEGAKVFTGWKVNQYINENTDKPLYKAYFYGPHHNLDPRKYLGVDLKVSRENSQKDVFELEIKGLVNVILTQRGQQTAEYLCRKLYKYFVYSNDKKVDQNVVKAMATTLINNNWEVRPVLQELLSSSAFYSSSVQGVQIKTPAETVAGFTKHFNVGDSWKSWVMDTMGLSLLNPPNVAGWPGYRTWLDAKTFPFGIQQMGNFIWNQNNDKLLAWIKTFNKYDDIHTLMPQIYTLLLAKQPTASMHSKYLAQMLGGSYDYEWPLILQNASTAGTRLKNMLNILIKSPDFHLN
jgi:uncharacterized protein (DUF1800 family)